MRSHAALVLLPLGLALAGCQTDGTDGEGGAGGGEATSSTTSSTTTSSTSSGTTSCDLDDATTETAIQSPTGCNVLDRDTAACEASRKAAGLDGFWLHFSCRVTLSKSGGVIHAESDGLPDYTSNYFPTADACHADYPGGKQNPNTLAAGDYDVGFPETPSGATTKMTGAVVGMALNGVVIFGDFAAPGDDIFQEAETFDACAGHPQNTGVYHYHAEPYALSYDDARFIGVMRDGSPIYGRRDSDGTMPADLDATGGHTGVTADSPSTAVYHYHVNLQTSTTPGTAGEQQWFITTGDYHASPGTCTGCM